LKQKLDEIGNSKNGESIRHRNDAAPLIQLPGELEISPCLDIIQTERVVVEKPYFRKIKSSLLDKLPRMPKTGMIVLTILSNRTKLILNRDNVTLETNESEADGLLKVQRP
jgi:hypothetical protein